ncbi:hypothetical protein ACI796_03695 [Geodermatophilus sp. SYSU D00525]
MPNTEFHRIPAAAPEGVTRTGEPDTDPREPVLVLPTLVEDDGGNSTWLLRVCDGNNRLSTMRQVLREARAADAAAGDARTDQQ